MSSLLQSSGRSVAGKHELFIEDADTATFTQCSICLKKHGGKLYRVWRKPAGIFGCWVLWRMNGKTHPFDLSVPIHMTKSDAAWKDIDHLPRDAEEVSDEESHQYWTKS